MKKNNWRYSLFIILVLIKLLFGRNGLETTVVNENWETQDSIPLTDSVKNYKPGEIEN